MSGRLYRFVPFARYVLFPPPLRLRIEKWRCAGPDLRKRRFGGVDPQWRRASFMQSIWALQKGLPQLTLAGA